jgi:hypothetical protein
VDDKAWRQIKHLFLYIEGPLPPISRKGLKYLVLSSDGGQSSEPFEPCPCDLSYLTHLTIYDCSTEQQLSLMKAYNIGEDLEFTYMSSNPGYAALARTPRLKILSLKNLGINMPLHDCPELRTVQCDVLYSNEHDERRRLQSQDYIVMKSSDFRHITNPFNCDFCQNAQY